MQNKYSKENLEKLVKESLSLAEVIRKLGLKPVGGNYHTIEKYCQQYQIDLTHLTGQAWRTGLDNTDKVALIKLNDILKENVNFKSSYLKPRLIKAGLKSDQCEICGCGNTWQNKPISLELHHINGDHFDNRLENLQILCPNCHSQTSNFRRQNKNKNKELTTLYKQRQENQTCTCMNCNKEFKSDKPNRSRKFCSIECYRKYVEQFGHKDIQKSSHVTSAFTLEELKTEMQNCNTITELARKLNSHRCTIREYLVRNRLYDEFAKKNKYIKNKKGHN